MIAFLQILSVCLTAISNYVSTAHVLSHTSRKFNAFYNINRYKDFFFFNPCIMRILHDVIMINQYFPEKKTKPDSEIPVCSLDVKTVNILL